MARSTGGVWVAASRARAKIAALPGALGWARAAANQAASTSDKRAPGWLYRPLVVGGPPRGPPSWPRRKARASRSRRALSLWRWASRARVCTIVVVSARPPAGATASAAEAVEPSAGTETPAAVNRSRVAATPASNPAAPTTASTWASAASS